MREAAEWFVRMRGRDASEHQAEFDAWIGRGALHRAAYNRAAEIYSMGKVLHRPQDSENAPSPPTWRKWVPFAVVAGAATVTLLGTWVAYQPERHDFVVDGVPAYAQVDPAQLVTVLGERRTYDLPDGSRATLESDSLLVVGFDKMRRNLRLHRGRARFDVAHETRPFVVYAGGGTITARGTIFEVAISAGHKVTVSLVRGAVDVLPPGHGLTGPATPGDRRQARTWPGDQLSRTGNSRCRHRVPARGHSASIN